MCKADREVRPIFFNKTHYLHCTMCVGAPFGIVHLAVFVIPVNMDITGSLGVLFAHLVISGLFGGFIALWTMIKAFYYLIIYPLTSIYKV